jgi:hypothetical protein
MSNVTTLRIVIASPSDVKEEREALNKIIERVNNHTAEGLGLNLKAVRWETDSYPGFHIDGSQGLIDPILKIEDCDILICVFWKRFGTPISKDGKTGTEHEFYKAYETWKNKGTPQIMLYFNKKENFPSDSKEAEQLTYILKFKENLPKECLYWEYKGLEEFKEFVHDHLTKRIKNIPNSINKSTTLETNTKINNNYPNYDKNEYITNNYISSYYLNLENSKFYYPEGIAIDSKGYVYVADEGNKIRKFDSNGYLLHEWGNQGTGDGEFGISYAVAVDKNDHVYISEDGGGRIQKFDNNGKFMSKFGCPGQKDGEFNSPFGMTIDKDGYIFVSEETNYRVQKFSSSGTFILIWGKHGNRDGEFNRPHGITVDLEDSIYVADSLNHRIQKFTNQGIFISKWGSKGRDHGKFEIPRDIKVNRDGKVYVSESGNHRVQVFIPQNIQIDIKEIYKEEIDFYLNKLSDSNDQIKESTWIALEKVARERRIWMHERIWENLNHEILVDFPNQFTFYSIDLLKTISYTSIKVFGKENNRILKKIEEQYKNKLIEILEDITPTWQQEKLNSKQILDVVLLEDRNKLYWQVWKKFALEIKDSNHFLKYSGYIIHDLEVSPYEFKKSIESELFELIGSDKNYTSERAKALHTLLF